MKESIMRAIRICMLPLAIVLGVMGPSHFTWASGKPAFLKDTTKALVVSGAEGLAITAAVEAIRKKDVDMSKYQTIYVTKARDRFRVSFYPPHGRGYPPPYSVHIQDGSFDLIAIQICHDICMFR